jgi:hypothetical protein
VFDNLSLPQKSKSELYSFIIQDLIKAKTLLAPEYMNGNNSPGQERVRPNKFAAHALLARTYLYEQDWQNAEAECDSIINAGLHYSLTALDDVFLKNSKEAIWQLQANLPQYNSYAGGQLQPVSIPPIISLSAGLMGGFELDDMRKDKWTTATNNGSEFYFWPYKFKIGQNAPSITEYTMVLRLAEIYLIRAEARGRQNNLVGALADLNAIRSRAGLASKNTDDQSEVLTYIDSERRLELFAEFGDRWLNLVRTSQADIVMPTVKGTDWDTNDQLYPIPINEITRRPGMFQNTGY